ncbi:MAG TPA: arginine--tRNA ligase [Chloroflexota bacterium]|nr:arginine--tRNA ligase [Chloroflexota bacterium]
MVEAPLSPLGILEDQCRALLEPFVPPGTELSFERPRSADLGDLSCSVALKQARGLGRPPMGLAEEWAAAASTNLDRAPLVREIRAARPGFLNFYAQPAAFASLVLAAVRAHGDRYGRPPDVTPRHVVVEHTSVNPNKPWHIGHVRNAVLGDVLGRVFRFAGHDVEIQNYIDDTGKQVADLLFGLAYLGMLSSEGIAASPGTEKADHFYGEAYVRINALVREGMVPAAEMEAGSARFMHARELGEYRDLVHTIVLAQLATAWRMDIFYDLLIWEGDIVQAHLFEEAMAKLRSFPSVFQQEEGRHRGCLVIEMGEFLPEGAGETGIEVDHPTERVLIRSNGLPTYTAKDIAYHMWKFALLDGDLRYRLDTVQPNGQELWTSSPNGELQKRRAAEYLINLIDVRQSLPQVVVKAALRVAGFEEAAAAQHHLGYGVVAPKGGKFSGREGTEHSADGVLEEVAAAQYARAAAKAVERGVSVPESELRATSELVAVGALRYLMCRYDPLRNVSFTIDEVIDGKGHTGLYVQYAYARTQSIFRKGGYLGNGDTALDERSWATADPALLVHERERTLLLLLARLPGVVTQVLEGLSIHLLADYAHELAEQFALFYEECPILRSDVPPGPRQARLALVAATAQTMRNVCALLGLALPDRL